MRLNKESFQGHRTNIAFTIGTILVVTALFWSKGQPQNFTPILAIWVGIMATFVSKNYLQSKIKGDNDGRNT